jgi:ribosome-associated protein
MAKTNTQAGKTTAKRGTAKTAATRTAGAKVTTAKVAAPKAVRTPKLPKSVAAVIRIAQDKKATDLVVLDLRKAGGFTDYFVICTGNNARQINAIADAVEDTLKKDLGERPTLAEGIEKSEWVLLDYFNFVVHVFSPDCRAFYGLERLWGSAERIEIPDL